MAKHKSSLNDKVAQEKLNTFKVGTGTKRMTEEYTLKPGGQIVRKVGKRKLTKAERKARTRQRIQAQNNQEVDDG